MALRTNDPNVAAENSDKCGYKYDDGSFCAENSTDKLDTPFEKYCVFHHYNNYKSPRKISESKKNELDNKEMGRKCLKKLENSYYCYEEKRPEGRCNYHVEDNAISQDVDFVVKIKEQIIGENYDFEGYYFPESIGQLKLFDEGFKTKKATKLTNTIFNCELNIPWGTFDDYVSFINCQFIKKVEFNDFAFTHKTDFLNTIFWEFVDFNYVRFEGIINFNNCLFVKGVNFKNCHPSNRFSFQNAVFLGESEFKQINFSSSQTYFSSCLFSSEVSFVECNLENTVFVSCNLTKLNFESANIIPATFINSDWNSSLDRNTVKIVRNNLNNENRKLQQVNGQAEKKKLISDNFEKIKRKLNDNIAQSKEVSLENDLLNKFESEIIQEKDLDKKHQIIIKYGDLFRQFKVKMDESKNYKLAHIFYRAEMEMQRKGTTKNIAKWFLTLYNWLGQYGTKPIQAIWVSLLILLILSIPLTFIPGLELKYSPTFSINTNCEPVDKFLNWSKKLCGLTLYNITSIYNSKLSIYEPINFKSTHSSKNGINKNKRANVMLIGYLSCIQYIIRPVLLAIIIISIRRKIQR